MIKFFDTLGRYCLLMKKVFSRPEKWSIYRKRIVFEMDALGYNSIGIAAIISIFMGAVVTLQMAINLESPFIPRSLIGYATRETMILEFSSTVVALILAGKVGSNIASEIGTMRITEQIDALEIMGINCNYIPSKGFKFFFNSILFGIGLAMDAFAVSVTNGMCLKKCGLKEIFAMALTFGLLQQTYSQSGVMVSTP